MSNISQKNANFLHISCDKKEEDEINRLTKNLVRQTHICSPEIYLNFCNPFVINIYFGHREYHQLIFLLVIVDN